MTEITKYNVLDVDKNQSIYNTYNKHLMDAVKLISNKRTQEILTNLIMNNRILIGIGSGTYDDFGTVLFSGNKVIGVAVNSMKIHIDITTGIPSNANDCLMFAYFLYITHIVHSSRIGLGVNTKFVDMCINYIEFMFFKTMKLSGYQEKEKKLIRELIALFFRKTILEFSTKACLSEIKEKEIEEFFAEKFQIIDKYKKFTDIFSAFSHLGIIREKTPNELLHGFISDIGVIPISILFKNIGTFAGGLIVSMYDNKTFKPLLIDYKLQTPIEQFVQDLHKKQQFSK
jgi:hypothetical protein